MRTVSKALLGTVAAGAMAVTSAAPAMARDRYGRDDGISTGEVIAGAVILGGIVAIASSIGKNRDRHRGDRRYDARYRDNYYRSRGNPRAAVEQCVRAAEGNANRYGYRADVTNISRVNDTRYGWQVRGNITVDAGRGYGRYNRRGGYDTGRFTCDISRGRVVDIDYHGIRGLR